MTTFDRKYPRRPKNLTEAVNIVTGRKGTGNEYKPHDLQKVRKESPIFMQMVEDELSIKAISA